MKSDVRAGTYMIVVAEGIKNASGSEIVDETAPLDAFGHKRLALDALRAQVWVFPDRVEVRGYMPTSSLTIGRTSA